MYSLARKVGQKGNFYGYEFELCDHIEDNLPRFVRQIIGADLVDYVREYRLSHRPPGTAVKGTGRVVDFMLNCSNGERILMEAKTVAYKETTAQIKVAQGIGQLLYYRQLELLAGRSVDRLILISDLDSPFLGDIINSASIDMELIYVDMFCSTFKKV